MTDQPAETPPEATPPIGGWSPIQPPVWTDPSGYVPSGPTEPGGPFATSPTSARLPAGYVPPGAAPPGYGPPPGYGSQYAAYAPAPPAPKPGIVPLRPLGLGEILDGAVTYIRANPRAVLGVSVVLALVAAVASFITNVVTWGAFESSLNNLDAQLNLDSGGSSVDTTSQLGSSLGELASSGVGALVGVVATGMFTVLIGHAVLGRRISARQAWSEARGRLLRLLGLLVLIVVATVGILVGGFVVLVVLAALLGAPGAVIGVVALLCLIPVSVWLWVSLSLAAPALMLERVGVVESMRRSFRLVRTAWWRIFGIQILAAIIASVIGGVLTVPFALIGGFSLLNSSSSSATPWLYLIGTAIGTLVATTVVQPFSAGVTALLYVDQRIRREALDLVLLDAATKQPAAQESRR